MIGKQILHYKVIEKLGEGGMGVVYLAEDIKLERKVAIKFLPQHIARDSDERKRFEIEAKAAAALNHRNIATIYAIEEANNELFLVMEYIDGRELKEILKSGPLELDKVKNYALQIAAGLQTAHIKGIVHRDIKSSNIMITADGNVKIMDFGLAKVRGGSQVTKAGTTLGTAAYMSPEQAKSQEADARSDIWSFGVVLYEMITGNLPFKGDYDAAITYAIINENYEPASVLRTGIPPVLENIINTCLQKDPSVRYQHDDALLDDLHKDNATNETSQRMPKSGENTGQRKTNIRRYSVFGIASLLVLLVPAAYFLFSVEPKSMERIPIVVADFNNETNEPELNGLSGLLITSLEQSKQLSVLSRARMFDILKIIDREDIKRIDETICREICRQSDIHAMITASVRKLGQRYSIDLKVLDPRKNEYLFVAKEDGQGQESIFSMIDNLAEKTRAGLQEKVEQIHTARQSIADVVTTDLEAYHHYFKGEELISRLKFKEAEDEFSKAVAIDTSFTLAYYRLAYAMQWWGGERAKEPIRKAMQLIQKVPEKERLYIQGMNEVIEDNINEAIVIYKKLLTLYPDEKEALYQVGDYSFHKTDYDTAVAYLGKVLNLDPLFERAYQHLIWTYGAMGKYDRALGLCKQYVAKVPGGMSYCLLGENYTRSNNFSDAFKTYRKALEIFPDNKMIIQGLGETYIFNNEYEKAEVEFKKLTRVSNSLPDQSAGHQMLAVLYAYLGRYHETLKMMDLKIEIDNKLQDNVALAADYAEKAYWLVSKTDNKAEAEIEIDKALKLKSVADQTFDVPLFYVYTILKEYQKASIISKKSLKIVPVYQTVLQADVEKSKGNYEDAVKFFHKAKALDHYRFSCDYELGQLYFDLGQYDNALQLIQSMQGNFTFYDSFIQRPNQYPRSFYLIGKIYEKKGKSKLASQNYQKFLKIWKDADPDIPELIDAQRRSAALKGVTVN